jgi:hypothetical protein
MTATEVGGAHQVVRLHRHHDPKAVVIAVENLLELRSPLGWVRMRLTDVAVRLTVWLP